MVEYWNSGILGKDYYYLKPKKIGIFSIQIMSSIYFIIPSFHYSKIPFPHSPSPYLPIFPLGVGGVDSLQSEFIHSSLSLLRISCCWWMAKSAYFGSLFR